MLGALILAFVIVVLLPVTLMMSGAVIAGVMGWLAKENAEATHEGSELIDLNT
jgi:hypothetical protein